MGGMTIHPALVPYVGIADLIVRTFAGSEVVLHDLADPRRSVVYAANGSVTGRRVGDSFEHLITEAVKAVNPEDGILANYYFEKDGRLFRSSTLLIRADDKRLLGALCINLDAESARQALSFIQAQLPGLTGLSQTPKTAAPGADAGAAPQETSHGPSVQDFVDDLVNRMIGSAASEGRLSREERLNLLAFMDERGVFLVKGAVELVARKLGLSKVTLYGDLDLLRTKGARRENPAQPGQQ